MATNDEYRELQEKYRKFVDEISAAVAGESLLPAEALRRVERLARERKTAPVTARLARALAHVEARIAEIDGSADYTRDPTGRPYDIEPRARREELEIVRDILTGEDA